MFIVFLVSGPLSGMLLLPKQKQITTKNQDVEPMLERNLLPSRTAQYPGGREMEARVYARKNLPNARYAKTKPVMHTIMS
jgi:hypothetical protein